MMQSNVIVSDRSGTTECCESSSDKRSGVHMGITYSMSYVNHVASCVAYVGCLLTSQQPAKTSPQP